MTEKQNFTHTHIAHSLQGFLSVLGGVMSVQGCRSGVDALPNTAKVTVWMGREDVAHSTTLFSFLFFFQGVQTAQQAETRISCLEISQADT